MLKNSFIPPREEDITFFMNSYNDAHLIPACLDQLHSVYPNVRVIIRSDGDPDPTIGEVARTYGADIHYGEWLFSIKRGGEIVHEMLRIYLENPTQWLFKIDPDTRVHRQFKHLPDQDCMFGTVQKQGGLFSLQGGCVGFTRGVSETLLRSNFFLDPTFGKVPPPWAINEALKERPFRGLTSIDWLLGWAGRKLGIPLIDWPEILSEWLTISPELIATHAITHPHGPTPKPKGSCLTSVRLTHSEILVESNIKGVQQSPVYLGSGGSHKSDTNVTKDGGG